MTEEENRDTENLKPEIFTEQLLQISLHLLQLNSTDATISTLIIS